MEIMTEAHKLIPGDLCDTDGDIARVLRGAWSTAIPTYAEIGCVEFPDKDRVPHPGHASYPSAYPRSLTG